MQKKAKATLVAPVTATPDGRWKLTCPQGGCGEAFTVKEEDLGKKIPCPKCACELRIGDKPTEPAPIPTAPEPTPVGQGTAGTNPPPTKPKADPAPESTVDLTKKGEKSFPTPKRPTPPADDDTHHTGNDRFEGWKKWAALVAIALAIFAGGCGGWLWGRLSAPDNSAEVLRVLKTLEMPAVKTADMTGVENELSGLKTAMNALSAEVKNARGSASAEAVAGLEKKLAKAEAELEEVNEAYDAVLDLMEVPENGDMSLQKLEVSGVGTVFRVVNTAGEGKVATP